MRTQLVLNSIVRSIASINRLDLEIDPTNTRLLEGIEEKYTHQMANKLFTISCTVLSQHSYTCFLFLIIYRRVSKSRIQMQIKFATDKFNRCCFSLSFFFILWKVKMVKIKFVGYENVSNNKANNSISMLTYSKNHRNFTKPTSRRQIPINWKRNKIYSVKINKKKWVKIGNNIEKDKNCNLKIN